MLEFVNSGLYFVQDENNLINNPLLQVGSGSNEKSTGSGGQKSPDPHPWLNLHKYLFILQSCSVRYIFCIVFLPKGYDMDNYLKMEG